jgi:hypothetical protein
VTGVEGARSRAKREGFQDAGTGILPEHPAALVLHALQFFCRVEEVGVLVRHSVVEAELGELLVQQLDEDVRHTGAGDVGFLQRLGHDADPGLRMDAWRATQRIPVEGRGSFSADRIDADAPDPGVRQGEECPVRTFPIHDQERDLMFQQSQRQNLRHVGLAPACDGENARVLHEVLWPQVKRVEGLVPVEDRAEKELAASSILRWRRQQDALVADRPGQVP